MDVYDIVGNFRSAAIRIGENATYPGSRRSPAEIGEVVKSVRDLMRESPSDVQESLGTAGQSLEVTLGEASRFYREPEFYETTKQ